MIDEQDHKLSCNNWHTPVFREDLPDSRRKKFQAHPGDDDKVSMFGCCIYGQGIQRDASQY